MKIKKKPRTIIVWTDFKFINNFSLPETYKMADALQLSDSLLTDLAEGFVMENRAQNKLKYQQAGYLYLPEK